MNTVYSNQSMGDRTANREFKRKPSKVHLFRWFAFSDLAAITGPAPEEENIDMVSDQELVLQCLNGDDRAWGQFVEDYRGPVYGVCCKFSSSDQDVEDLMQEAFIKIWTNLGTYVPARGTLRGWVTAIARNAGIDRYRKNADQRRTSSIDESLPQSEITPLEQFVDSGPSALDIVATSEMAEIVLQVAKEIPPDMWQAVSMKFLHELDNYEIASRLRIPEGTVKSRINRGRTHLATLLYPMRLAFGAV